MRPLSVVAAIAFALSLLGCATNPHSAGESTSPNLDSDRAQRNMLVGTWVGEDETRRWLTRMHADGQFEITFHIENSEGGVDVSHEVGYWGASGGIHFVLILGWFEDGCCFVPANRSDAYRIIDLTPERFEYELLPTGEVFVERRVADDYKMAAHN